VKTYNSTKCTTRIPLHKTWDELKRHRLTLGTSHEQIQTQYIKLKDDQHGPHPKTRGELGYSKPLKPTLLLLSVISLMKPWPIMFSTTARSLILIIPFGVIEVKNVQINDKNHISSRCLWSEYENMFHINMISK
jgi:hypothetical protein